MSPSCRHRVMHPCREQGFSSSVLPRQGLLEPAGREDPKREKERLGLEAVPNWAMERFMTNRLDEVGGPSGLKTALVLHSSLVLAAWPSVFMCHRLSTC